MRSSVLFFLLVVFVPGVHARDRRRRVDVLGLSAHASAAVGAGFELSEDVESLGHGHGMVLLQLSKLARETNELCASVREVGEDATTGGGTGPTSTSTSARIRSLSAALSAAALYASASEVREDLFPLGGHHGAVFLALHDLNELLADSGLARGLLRRVVENRPLELFLLGGALASACYEVWDSEKNRIGGHHGVAVLAALKTIQCLQSLRELRDEKED